MAERRRKYDHRRDAGAFGAFSGADRMKRTRTKIVRVLFQRDSQTEQEENSIQRQNTSEPFPSIIPPCGELPEYPAEDRNDKTPLHFHGKTNAFLPLTGGAILQ